MGLMLLKDLRVWTATLNNQVTFAMHPTPPGKWSEAQERNWELVRETFQCSSTEMLFVDQLDLLLSRAQRKATAETYIASIANYRQTPPTREAKGTSHWESDGSMVPATAGILDNKLVTAAITGPRSATLKLAGRNISILHGKLMGLILRLIMSDMGTQDETIHTDHLNSGHETKILYTRGYSTKQTLPSILNNNADCLAVQAQTNLNTPIAPVPTFLMDQYTLYTQRDGAWHPNWNSALAFVSDAPYMTAAPSQLTLPALYVLLLSSGSTLLQSRTTSNGAQAMD
ncbi:hypothetical protein C0993_001456 [Termitomyces sp. T159_Od127]|nr:hypothetical protein C0993_001456 [Termitomyces sp. T159_Od127]